MDALMHYDYMQQFEADQAAKRAEHKKQNAKIPILHTRASLGHRKVDLPEAQDPVKNFKMKKFANVKSKLHAK